MHLGMIWRPNSEGHAAPINLSARFKRWFCCDKISHMRFRGQMGQQPLLPVRLGAIILT